MRLILLLISILVIAMPVEAALADVVWSVGSERFGQAAAQNDDAKQVVDAYYLAQSDPNGYVRYLTQSTFCNEPENQQACTTLNTVQGLTGGGTEALIGVFCFSQQNRGNELCQGYQNGLQQFNQITNVQNQFQNPSQAAQAYAMGEMTKSINPELGGGMQTVSRVQGQLNSLRMVSSGNSDYLLSTALRYGADRAEGRNPGLHQVTGFFSHTQNFESDIETSRLRTRKCLASFNLDDGSISEVYGCKTKAETDINPLLNGQRTLLLGQNCGMVKRQGEVIVVPEGQCSVRFAEQQLAFSRELFSALDENDFSIYPSYGEANNRIIKWRVKDGNQFSDAGNIVVGNSLQIKEVPNAIEVRGENFEVDLPNRDISVKNGGIQLFQNKNVNLGFGTEANVLSPNAGVYMESQDSVVAVSECAQIYPRTGNIVDFCTEDETFFARGSGFQAGPVRQIVLERSQAVADIAFLHSLSSETVCRFNRIEPCSRDTRLSRGRRVILPVALYELRDNGRITRKETMVGDRREITERANGEVLRAYNLFGIENLDRVILRTNLPIIAPNIASVTRFEDTGITAFNTEEGTCLSRQEQCGGIGSLTIRSNPTRPLFSR